jgi:hypothetical protein
MQAEIRQATSGAAMVSLRIDEQLDGVKLPEHVPQVILTGVLRAWAESAIQDRGVLDLDIQLSTAKSLDDKLFEQVDYMVMADLLDEKIQQIYDNINKLLEIEGAATTSDLQTGLRLADLKAALDDLDRYVVDELMSPIRSLGLTRNLALSVYYYEDKLRVEKEKLALFEDQANLVKQAYDSYFVGNGNGASVSRDALSQGNYYPQQGAGTLLDGDALQRMIDMAAEQKTEEYRQKLNQEWLNLNMQAANVKSKIREIEILIGSLKATDVSEDEMGLRKSYLSRAEEVLPKIVAQLRDYFDVTARIYKQLSLESVGGTQKLYAPISHKVLVDKAGVDIKRTVLIWAALVFLTLMVVVPLVMIRNAMRKRSSEEGA